MKINARTRARRLAVQGLYEWQVSGNAPGDIEKQYLVEKELHNVDIPYFRELLIQVPKHQAALDEAIAPLLSRKMAEVDPVEQAVLRVGVYELVHHPDIPYRVVINESVELAKLFGAEQGHRFVNGIMDRLAASLRSTEVAASHS
ncbi:MAG: transcription antitermination factor NusB [Proteobacteria bacterium]|jgi:transcription antitermination protein NusB|nr:transcription antitermination factor NusB [Pseudomonadota bacterium]MCG6935927.1 transcription antitermination factor NusB [Pseudomonadota bacterium]